METLEELRKNKYAVECIGCMHYKTGYDLSLGTAEAAAEMHVMLGSAHVCVITDTSHTEIMRVLHDEKR